MTHQEEASRRIQSRTDADFKLAQAMLETWAEEDRRLRATTKWGMITLVAVAVVMLAFIWATGGFK